MDIPAEYDDGHFSPRSGMLDFVLFRLVKLLIKIAGLSDMFGFKIEVPKREGSLKDKTRAIYLDMQVRRAL